MKLLSVVKYVGISIYLICGFMLLALLLPQGGWKALIVATPSMSPAIGVGELTVARALPPSQLQVGDIVTYINPNKPSQTITHRIVSKGLKDNRIPVFVTKGDANDKPDPEIVGGNVIGKVVVHNLWLGRVVKAVQSPWGLIALVALPALLIIVDEVRRLRRALRQPEPPHRQPPAEGPPSHTTRPQTKLRRQSRGIDSIGPAIVLLMGLGLTLVSPTQAQLQREVSLTNNTITVKATPAAAEHLVINQVIIKPANCLAFGLGKPTFSQGLVCRWHFANGGPLLEDTFNTPLQVETLEVQPADKEIPDLWRARNVITINHNNRQIVRLYNPGNQTVRLNHWRLTDNSHRIFHFPGNTKIASHGFLTIFNRVGNLLDPLGDRLVLTNPAGDTVDAISWGSDDTQMKPSLAPLPVGGSIKRNPGGPDTDSARDWTLLAP